MSQRFLICNLDTQEVLKPRAFGDGDCVTEFTKHGQGVLQAQTVLTSDGGGRGWGDISRMAYSTEPPEVFNQRNGERILIERECTHDHEYRTLPDDNTCLLRVFVPESAGKWAGERIVTAGEHGEPGKFLSQVQIDHYKIRGAHRGTFKATTDTPNLFEFASSWFTDISHEVKSQLRLFNTGRSSVGGIESRYEYFTTANLLAEFDPGTVVGKGHRCRNKHDLTWMSFSHLEKFILEWKGDFDLRAVKAWLRAQTLLPWQAECLKLFQVRNHRVKVTAYEHVRDLMKEHNVPEVPGHPGDWGFGAMLPRRPYLEAAIEVQMRQEGREFRHRSDDATIDNIKERLSIPVERRIIDIGS